MRLSLILRERLIRTASSAGMALALAIIALASPTPTLAANGSERVAWPLEAAVVSSDKVSDYR